MSAIMDAGKKCANLKEGWYCIGMLDADDVMQWNEIIEYVGEGEWHNDDGEVIYSLWDAFLQMPVATDAADAYQPQF